MTNTSYGEKKYSDDYVQGDPGFRQKHCDGGSQR